MLTWAVTPPSAKLGNIEALAGQLLQVCLEIGQELRLGGFSGGLISRLDDLHKEYVRGLGPVGTGLATTRDSSFGANPKRSTS